MSDLQIGRGSEKSFRFSTNFHSLISSHHNFHFVTSTLLLAFEYTIPKYSKEAWHSQTKPNLFNSLAYDAIGRHHMPQAMLQVLPPYFDAYFRFAQLVVIICAIIALYASTLRCVHLEQIFIHRVCCIIVCQFQPKWNTTIWIAFS